MKNERKNSLKQKNKFGALTSTERKHVGKLTESFILARKIWIHMVTLPATFLRLLPERSICR